jgi:hypothetical protein
MMPQPQISVRKRIFQVLAIMVVVTLSAYICSAYKAFAKLRQEIPESYAAWTAGNLMVEYSKTHSNKWPRGWDDLRSATNSLLQRGMPVYMPLDTLTQFVRIDWKADTKGLLQAAHAHSNASIRVVTRLDGSGLWTKWGNDTEPNGKIMRYLKTQ